MVGGTHGKPPSVVVTYDVRFGADNVLDIIDGYDVIVDGADNFPSRYLLNDASVKLGIPVESQILSNGIRKAERTAESGLAILGPDNHMDVINASLSGTVKVGSASWPVAGLNWQSLAGTGVSLYTRAWGTTRHAGGQVRFRDPPLCASRCSVLGSYCWPA